MASIDEFRQEVRSWLDENLPAELRLGTRRGLPSELMKKWILAVGKRGWITPEWPTEYGGGGLDRKHAVALRAELKAVRAPIISSFGS